MNKKKINKDIVLTPLQRTGMILNILKAAEKNPEFKKIALQRVEESRIKQLQELEEIQKESVLTKEQQEKLEELIVLGETVKQEQKVNRITLEEKAKTQNQ